MKETANHQRAFEAYYSLGASRTLTAAAAKLGVSVASLKKWSGAFSWQTRIAERDAAVSGIVRERTTEREVTRQERNRKIVEAGIIATARAIADGRIRPSLSDLDRLMRLEAFLEGEVESRHEIVARDLRDKSTAELREILRSELQDLEAIEAEFSVERATEGPSDGLSAK
ncbi:MAG: hypothetical protein DHS20C21_07200 [Gemmatimonadota bacterium]|nr:MAG: hypothetical protein DHS20C21_07200 [Gemmatimonadota bacterium]